MNDFKIEQDLIHSTMSTLSFDKRTSKKIQFLKLIRNLYYVYLGIWILVLFTTPPSNYNLYIIIASIVFFFLAVVISVVVAKNEKQYLNYSLEFIKDLKDKKEYVLSNLNRFRLYRKLSEKRQNDVKEYIISLLALEYTDRNFKDLIDSRFDNFNDFEFVDDIDILARLFINKTNL